MKNLTFDDINNAQFKLYFNARNTSDILKGRECIGIYEAELKTE